MNHVQSLIRLIDKGLSAQLMFRDGSMIVHFQPHDIVARGSLQAGVVVVRGMVCAGDAAPQDKVVPLCDLTGVFSARIAFEADPDFFRRNPVAKGWTTIRSRRQDAATVS